MTEPYGQPEPFDPAKVVAAPNRTKPSSRRFLPVLGALVLAAVAFGGGFAVANAVAPKTTTAANGQGFGGQFGPGASGRPRGGGNFGGGAFGGGATGTVGSVSSNQMTITTAAGAQRIVLLTPTTTVTQVTSATKALSDIASGTTVTVVGTSNPDGSVTATSVVIGNVNLFGRGGRPDGSAAPTTAP
jgi:hypothetical protein